MRLNKYIAAATGLSRRAADTVILEDRVRINGQTPSAGQQVQEGDSVTLDSRPITPPVNTITIMLNKPAGYVTSRAGQGSRTVYDLLPEELHNLKPIGRLDKESSGLLLMTTDGELAHQLTHPSFEKTKVYEITLDTPLLPLHRQLISDHGVTLEDGVSRFSIERMSDGDDRRWRITMHEGRNRQIRRTFAALGYTVIKLHRTHFGKYQLADTPAGKYIPL
jgi:23S rRNA pseudouridine2605 synthase